MALSRQEALEGTYAPGNFSPREPMSQTRHLTLSERLAHVYDSTNQQKPDALGRAPTTPVRIQRVMRGELDIPTRQPSIRAGGRVEKVIPEYERLERERAVRKRAAKKERNQGNGAHRQGQVPGAFGRGR